MMQQRPDHARFPWPPTQGRAGGHDGREGVRGRGGGQRGVGGVPEGPQGTPLHPSPFPPEHERRRRCPPPRLPPRPGRRAASPHAALQGCRRQASTSAWAAWEGRRGPRQTTWAWGATTREDAPFSRQALQRSPGHAWAQGHVAGHSARGTTRVHGGCRGVGGMPVGVRCVVCGVAGSAWFV